MQGNQSVMQDSSQMYLSAPAIPLSGRGALPKKKTKKQKRNMEKNQKPVSVYTELNL